MPLQRPSLVPHLSVLQPILNTGLDLDQEYSVIKVSENEGLHLKDSEINMHKDQDEMHCCELSEDVLCLLCQADKIISRNGLQTSENDHKTDILKGGPLQELCLRSEFEEIYEEDRSEISSPEDDGSECTSSEYYEFVLPFSPNRQFYKPTYSRQKPASTSKPSPMRAHLIANQLLKYQHEPDFHEFMTRFHTLPYATEFKFEVNTHINEHFAAIAERSLIEEIKRQEAFLEAQIQVKNSNLVALKTRSNDLLSDNVSRLLTISEEEGEDIESAFFDT